LELAEIPITGLYPGGILELAEIPITGLYPGENLQFRQKFTKMLLLACTGREFVIHQKPISGLYPGEKMKNSPRLHYWLATGSSSSAIVAEMTDLAGFAIVNGSR
jgi:hypothetical protein